MMFKSKGHKIMIKVWLIRAANKQVLSVLHVSIKLFGKAATERINGKPGYKLN